MSINFVVHMTTYADGQSLKRTIPAHSYEDATDISEALSMTSNPDIKREVRVCLSIPLISSGIVEVDDIPHLINQLQHAMQEIPKLRVREKVAV